MEQVTPNKAKIRIEAKCRLTDRQYYGGPNMTPADHSRVSEVMELIFGDYKFEVPPVCTAQWGFEAWANYIGWPEIAKSANINPKRWWQQPKFGKIFSK